MFFPDFLDLEIMVLYSKIMEMKQSQLHFTTKVGILEILKTQYLELRIAEFVVACHPSHS